MPNQSAILIGFIIGIAFTLGFLLRPVFAADGCYLCSIGYIMAKRPSINPAESTGCGAEFSNALDAGFDFSPCCNQRRICYSSCHLSKSNCDDILTSCVSKICMTQSGNNINQCNTIVAAHISTQQSVASCTLYRSIANQYCTCQASSLRDPRLGPLPTATRTADSPIDSLSITAISTTDIITSSSVSNPATRTRSFPTATSTHTPPQADSNPTPTTNTSPMIMGSAILSLGIVAVTILGIGL